MGGGGAEDGGRGVTKPDDIRIELIIKGSLKTYQENCVDVSEIFSQPRVAQEAAMRRHGGTDLRPGWSIDLTREDP